MQIAQSMSFQAMSHRVPPARSMTLPTLPPGFTTTLPSYHSFNAPPMSTLTRKISKAANKGTTANVIRMQVVEAFVPEHEKLEGRLDHTLSLVGNSVYVIGGVNGTHLCKSVGVFDVTTAQLKYRQLSPKSDCPNPQMGHSACVFDSRIFVFGGSNSRKAENNVLVFDTISESWSVAAVTGNIPPPLVSHSAVAFENGGRKWMIVMGGMAQKQPGVLEPSNSIFILDIMTMTWISPPVTMEPINDAQPAPRFGHIAIVDEEFLVINGGGDAQITHADTIVFDIEAMPIEVQRLPFISSAFNPTPRLNHAASRIEGTQRFLVFGGISATNQVLDDAYVFDANLLLSYPIQLQGKPLPPLSRHRMFSLKDRIVIFGGLLEAAPSNRIFMILYQPTAATNVGEVVTPAAEVRTAAETRVFQKDPKSSVFAWVPANEKS
eukprot:c8488_g1_i1.p1 GENE.c8488_g1_i1~~c8488_g1_i1.p1  ORF type:complete len:458 (+),score=126.57 c8488_g1_i1:72-1376(+)